MQNVITNHKSTYYRVVKTKENLSGHSVVMYGINGFSDGEVVSVLALSTDKKRIVGLVNAMNSCDFELCRFRKVVYECLQKCCGTGDSKD